MKKTDRQTDGQAGVWTDRQRDPQADRQTDKPTGRQSDGTSHLHRATQNIYRAVLAGVSSRSAMLPPLLQSAALGGWGSGARVYAPVAMEIAPPPGPAEQRSWDVAVMGSWKSAPEREAGVFFHFTVWFYFGLSCHLIESFSLDVVVCDSDICDRTQQPSC